MMVFLNAPAEPKQLELGQNYRNHNMSNLFSVYFIQNNLKKFILQDQYGFKKWCVANRCVLPSDGNS